MSVDDSPLHVFFIIIFWLLSHLRLSQWKDDTVVGRLNHFIVITLFLMFNVFIGPFMYIQ